jgi:hypothetical protein
VTAAGVLTTQDRPIIIARITTPRPIASSHNLAPPIVEEETSDSLRVTSPALENWYPQLEQYTVTDSATASHCGHGKVSVIEHLFRIRG